MSECLIVVLSVPDCPDSDWLTPVELQTQSVLGWHPDAASTQFESISPSSLSLTAVVLRKAAKFETSLTELPKASSAQSRSLQR